MRDDEFEWDDRKEAANRRKHGVAFEIARSVFDDLEAVEAYDETSDEEDRFLIIGKAGAEILTVVYTERGKRRRIISARKASAGERKTYGEP